MRQESPERLLLVEDDPLLANALAAALRGVGYAVDLVGTAAAACAALDSTPYDLMILDLGLPDRDGSEVVRHLATQGSDLPILVLSGRDGLDERVRLLDLGADDYLVKPAALDEFLARVRAGLRRRRLAGGGARLNLGRLSLDLEGKRAYLGEQPLELNSREWALLVFFAGCANRVVSKEKIAAALYGADEVVSMNALDQMMSRFRKRVAIGRLRLRTIRGLGYYLETDEAPPRL